MSESHPTILQKSTAQFYVKSITRFFFAKRPKTFLLNGGCVFLKSKSLVEKTWRSIHGRSSFLLNSRIEKNRYYRPVTLHTHVMRVKKKMTFDFDRKVESSESSLSCQNIKHRKSSWHDPLFGCGYLKFTLKMTHFDSHLNSHFLLRI